MRSNLLHWGVRGLSSAIVAAAVFTAVPVEAQIIRVGSTTDTRHAFGFTLGYFTVTSDDDRDPNDVIFRNQDSLRFVECEEERDFESSCAKVFNAVTFGGEYLFALTDYLEAGAGISYYQGTAPSIYRRLEEADGSEIQQELKLRQIPLTASVRFLPLGRRSAVQPYVGAGITWISWRYSESGEFVDFENNIFRDTFTAKGTAAGPVVLAGVRFPVADVWTVGGEVRWHRAEGETGGIDAGFLGDKIDLGGWTYNFAAHFRF